MKKILEEFEKAERILITGHINPDGDCVGAGLGLMLALNEINKENKKVVRFILQDSPPKTTKFLFAYDLIETLDNYESKYNFDLAFVLDSGAYDRIGKVRDLIGEGTKVINIDHHVSNDLYGHINYVDTKLSSTSEYIYHIIKELGINVTEAIGEALYVGLVNDTGNFSYTNVSSKTFLVASELREVGVNNEKIVREFYSKKSLGRLRLLGYAMENFEFYEDKKLSYLYLSREVMEKYSNNKEDTEGVVEALRSYEKAQVALFIREELNGTLKGSLRSNGIDVNKIAGSFGGGGHIKAAGFSTNFSGKEVVKKILELI